MAHVATTPSAASQAALATLTIGQSVYDADLVLQLVTKLASPLQLSVKIVAASTGSKQPPVVPAVVQLVLGCDHTDSNAVQLTARNAIVRSLIGPGLLYALDQGPFYLLGGHGQAARSCSMQSAVAVGAITSWMSLADTIRTGKDDLSQVLPRLNSHLTNSAFLIPAAQPTIADIDLAIAILSSPNAAASIRSYPTAVTRWLDTVVAVTMDYATKVGLRGAFEKICTPVLSSSKSAIPPIFFYGTEDPSSILKPPQKEKSGAVVPEKQQGKKPQQQQAEQQPATKQEGKKQEKQQQPKGEKEQESKQQQQQDDDVDISALDIRVGKIVKVWPHAEAEKLFCEEIDLGTETRSIASGLRPFYKQEDLQDKHVLVLCNLKKRNLVGFPSHGMVLCASNADHTQVELVVPPEGTALGERVLFEGITMKDPEPENKLAKKKMFEKLAPDLQTDATGQVVWKGAVAKTSAGIVKAINAMPGAHVS